MGLELSVRMGKSCNGTFKKTFSLFHVSGDHLPIARLQSRLLRREIWAKETRKRFKGDLKLYHLSAFTAMFVECYATRSFRPILTVGELVKAFGSGRDIKDIVSWMVGIGEPPGWYPAELSRRFFSLIPEVDRVAVA